MIYFLKYTESETAFSIFPLTSKASEREAGSGSDETGSTIRSRQDISQSKEVKSSNKNGTSSKNEATS